MALKKKSIILLLVFFTLALSFSIVFGARGRTEKPKAIDTHRVAPSGQLAALPSTYADLPPPRPTARPQIMRASPRELSELEKLRAQLAADRLKRAVEARHSKVAFDLQIPSSNAASTVRGEPPVEGRSPEEIDRTSRDDANRQDDKLGFLNQSKVTETTLRQPLRPLASKYSVLAGTIIPGLLLTGLNSDLPGEIIGQVSENVFDSASGKYLLVPQGTRVLGHYDSRITYGQERLLVVWSRLIFPSGKSIVLMNMPGTDQAGTAGLEDIVDSHYGRLAAGIVLSSVLGAAAQMAQGPNYAAYNPSYDQLAVQGVARNTNEAGQRIVDRTLNIQPTIKIRAGTRFNVFVNKDMLLEPVNE